MGMGVSVGGAVVLVGAGEGEARMTCPPAGVGVRVEAAGRPAVQADDRRTRQNRANCLNGNGEHVFIH